MLAFQLVSTARLSRVQYNLAGRWTVFIVEPERLEKLGV